MGSFLHLWNILFTSFILWQLINITLDIPIIWRRELVNIIRIIKVLQGKVTIGNWFIQKTILQRLKPMLANEKSRNGKAESRLSD